ncbi:MAG: NINE protein [Bacteroidota bacterium]
MKNKTTAATLAFFGGFLGLHKFYLQEEGTGVFYLILSVIGIRLNIIPLGALLGVIDCIVLLNMSERDFNQKYNRNEKDSEEIKPKSTKKNSRYERYQERERQRRQRGNSRSFQRKRKVPDIPASSSPRMPKKQMAKIQANLEEGIRYFKDFEFDRAIKSFERVLELDPTNVAGHFNIACAYSSEEQADKAFYHIDRAVALGFQDFERIRTHDSLAYLRIQDEFPMFAEGGFRLSPDVKSKPESSTDTMAPSEERTEAEAAPTGDLLDQLNRLAELKEKGLLTEAEFTRQKKRLLG